MTSEQKEKYLNSRGIYCPYCDSKDIESTNCDNYDLDYLRQSVHCFSCKNEWFDIYKLVDVNNS